ncbi:sulfatase [Acidobacteriota bacterium]
MTFLGSKSLKGGVSFGFLLGTFLGLGEGAWIVFSDQRNGGFADFLLFLLTVVLAYTVQGIVAGLGSAIIVRITAGILKKLFGIELSEVFQSSVIQGLIAGVFLFVYTRLYIIRSVGLWATLLLFVALFALCWLVSFVFQRLFIRAASLPNFLKIRYLLIIAAVLILSWITTFYFMSSRDYLPSSPSKANDQYPNIVIITIDTLRADHLGCYGYQDIQTPVLDKLAREGILFKQHICQQPVTTASHVSLFTSTYPLTNGVQGNNRPLKNDAVTLAEILKKRGYVTGAFVSAYPVKAHSSNLDQGFDEYDDRLSFIDYLPGKASIWFMKTTVLRIVETYLEKTGAIVLLQRRGDNTTRAALRWLDRIGDQRFFMWLHYFDPHAPYDPPVPFESVYDPHYSGSVDGSMRSLRMIWDRTLNPSEADIRHIISLYDGEISFTDQQIGVFLDRLKERRLLDNSLITVTADHGESLWEHDYNFRHGDFLYEGSMMVPLIIRLPGGNQAGREISTLTENVDLVPTILEIIGIEKPESQQGESLLGLLQGETESNNKTGFSQAKGKRDESEAKESRRYALRTAEWKLIANEGAENELYNLIADPHEQNDCVASQPEISEKYRKLLEQKLLKITRSGEELPEYDEDTMRRLKSLGYID